MLTGKCRYLGLRLKKTNNQRDMNLHQSSPKGGGQNQEDVTTWKPRKEWEEKATARTAASVTQQALWPGEGALSVELRGQRIGVF